MFWSSASRQLIIGAVKKTDFFSAKLGPNFHLWFPLLTHGTPLVDFSAIEGQILR
jgi:hypothetical protein